MKNIFDRIAAASERNSDLAEEMAADLPVEGASVLNEDSTSSSTPQTVKETVQELLKHGYLEEGNGRGLFKQAIVHEAEVNAVLEPLDLALRIDSHRGVAFLAVGASVSHGASDDEGWSHPLVRRQRLTLEQSIIVAILRETFMLHEQESGVGQSPARVAVYDLLPRVSPYFGDTGSDTKNESRLLNLLDQLKTYGIVSEVDKQQEVIVRPLIAHLANPDSLAALLQIFKQNANAVEGEGSC